MVTAARSDWVLLTYRLPREPSAPRLALWRAIRRLGALQLGDGLVALPYSARNLEHIQWLAADIVEHDGTATVWRARPDSRRENVALAAAIRESVDAEYRAVLAEAAAGFPDGATDNERRRLVRRLRGQLRRVGLRDHFDAPIGADAHAEVERLARALEIVPA